METWMILGAFGASAICCVLVVWRWSRVNTRRLSDARCRELADRVVADLFARAADAGELIRITPGYWRSHGLSPPEVVELARWMVGHGYVSAGDWSSAAVFLGSPPECLALTRRSMELALRPDPAPVVDSGGGPVNYGSGIQVVAGRDALIGPGLAELASAVREDAARLGDLERAQALEAADTLEAAARGEIDGESPRVTGTLRWLRERVDAAVGGALGAALWASTSAALARLFGG